VLLSVGSGEDQDDDDNDDDPDPGRLVDFPKKVSDYDSSGDYSDSEVANPDPSNEKFMKGEYAVLVQPNDDFAYCMFKLRGVTDARVVALYEDGRFREYPKGTYALVEYVHQLEGVSDIRC
jgi:hypothetical protein